MEQLLNKFQGKKGIFFILFFLFLSILFGVLYVKEATAEESFSCPKLQTFEEEQIAKEDGMYVVDIKGAVKNPGVYRIENSKIVNDVIEMAGGLLESADTSNLNLSKQISNEMVINVLTKEEITTEKSKTNTNSLWTNEAGVQEESSETLINLNTATLEELISLPGIGESKAKLIIDYRNTCGKILKKEEIKNIKGIGNSIYEKLEKYITV